MMENSCITCFIEIIVSLFLVFNIGVNLGSTCPEAEFIKTIDFCGVAIALIWLALNALTFLRRIFRKVFNDEKH